MKSKLLMTTALMAGSLILSACGGPTETDKIAEAQNCLDRAASSEAAACVSKVDGLESQGAYLIRCVGKFAKEGYNDPAKIATAFSSVSNGNSGSSGSTEMMAKLAFSSESTLDANSTSAQEAFSYCSKAGSPRLVLLSSLSKIATSTVALAGLIGDLKSLQGTDVKTAMQNLLADPTKAAAAKELVGSSVKAIYESSCSGTTTSSTGNFCTQFQSAVSTVPGGLTNTTAIGEQIMTCYTNPSGAGCSGF